MLQSPTMQIFLLLLLEPFLENVINLAHEITRHVQMITYTKVEKEPHKEKKHFFIQMLRLTKRKESLPHMFQKFSQQKSFRVSFNVSYLHFFLQWLHFFWNYVCFRKKDIMWFRNKATLLKAVVPFTKKIASNVCSCRWNRLVLDGL